MQHQEET